MACAFSETYYVQDLEEESVVWIGVHEKSGLGVPTLRPEVVITRIRAMADSQCFEKVSSYLFKSI